MNLISTLLFTISTNLDNIPIGIAYSLKNNKLKFKNLFQISFFTSLITFIIMIFGSSINFLLPESLANKIGAYILIIIGSYGILKEIILNILKKNPSINKKSIDSIYHTALILSINNLSTGLSASITGINPIYATIFTFIFSFIFLYIGFFISKKISNRLINYISEYLSFIIILILGIIELI